MDIVKTMKKIHKNGEQIFEDQGYSVMTVAVSDSKVIISCTGNLNDQIRGLASLFLTTRDKAVKVGSNEKWNRIWQRELSTANLNKMLNKRGKKKDE